MRSSQGVPTRGCEGSHKAARYHDGTTGGGHQAALYGRAIMETDIEHGGVRIVVQPMSFGGELRSFAHVVRATLRAHDQTVDQLLIELRKIPG